MGQGKPVSHADGGPQRPMGFWRQRTLIGDLHNSAGAQLLPGWDAVAFFAWLVAQLPKADPPIANLDQLARAAGMHPSTLSYWKTGKTATPTTPKLAALADALGVPHAEIYRRAGLVDYLTGLVVDERHLWEVDHPYYCGEASLHTHPESQSNHGRWDSWADFRDSTFFVTGNRDLNLLARWDWMSWRRHPEAQRRADAPDELYLFFVMQRKGYLASHYITVTDEDEAQVREFLVRCAAMIAALWAPLAIPAAAPLGSPMPMGR